MSDLLNIDKIIKDSTYVKELIEKARKEQKSSMMPNGDIDNFEKFKIFVSNANSGENKSSNVTQETQNKLKTLKLLFEQDKKIIKEYDEVKKLSESDKKVVKDLMKNLEVHQIEILKKSDTSPRPEVSSSMPNLINLIKAINDKISTLTKISKNMKTGGSISTNNSIRRQIFTDLKYITKYLKYKTKYMIFKRKH